MQYTKEQFNPATYWADQVAKTKRFGHTYVHTCMRAGDIIDGIRYHVSGFGRSLQTSNGHKYKVTAHQD
jgi:hypothetical protein